MSVVIGHRNYQTQIVNRIYKGNKATQLEKLHRDFFDAWLKLDDRKVRRTFKVAYFEFNEQIAHELHNSAFEQWLNGAYIGVYYLGSTVE